MIPTNKDPDLRVRSASAWRNRYRYGVRCGLICGLLFQLGCASMWDELNPRRLNKLNQGPPPPEMRDFTQRTKSLDVQFAKWQPTLPPSERLIQSTP